MALIVGGIVILLAGMVAPAYAQTPAPTPEAYACMGCTPNVTVTPAPSPDVSTAASSSAETLSLPPLKAVLIVGPIANNGDPTPYEQQMDLAYGELVKNNVSVTRLYTPNATWARVKAAAQGAHFLFYGGDGVGGWANNTVGGFSLDDGMISPDQVRNELKLATNAIVMINGCFAAGSSGDPNEILTSAQAKTRVAQYSGPFFAIGAGGYFADWYPDAFQSIVRYLFQGKTLGQAYQSYADFASGSLEQSTHPDYPSLALWLDKGAYNHQSLYSYAFAGKANATLQDLFPQSTMVLSATSLTFLADSKSTPQTQTVHIDNSTSGTFDWTASSNVSWVTNLQPSAGKSGTYLSITVNSTGQSVGAHQASITVNTGTPGIQNSNQTINVTLRVVGQLDRIYLPALVK